MTETKNVQDGVKNPAEVGEVATYEQCIATYLVGALVLHGVIDPFELEENGSKTGLPYPIEIAAEALEAGLRAYGWDSGIKSLIHFAQLGENAASKRGAE